MPSLEYRHLTALLNREQPAPEVTRAGDLWHLLYDKRLSYVMLVLGHKKNSRRRQDGHTYVFLYHWGKPSLLARPADLRDYDGNAMSAEASLRAYMERGEGVRYIGNLFEMLPYSELLP